jgi:hypothetical protein
VRKEVKRKRMKVRREEVKQKGKKVGHIKRE